MGKKYLDTKEGSLEQSVLGVWQTAIDEGEARMDGRTKQYKEHRAKLEAARLRREKKKLNKEEVEVDEKKLSPAERDALQKKYGSKAGKKKSSKAYQGKFKEGSKEEYQKFFNAAMKKFGIDSPADLKSDEEKKKFFDYVDKNYKGEKDEEVQKLHQQLFPETKLKEGKMSQLHQLMKDGKSAKEIAKIMKLDVKTIQALMDEKSELEEKRHRDVDPADIDTSATDDDIKAADKNIMMQLRKSVSLRGQFPVEFLDKKKVKIPQKIAQAALTKYNSLKKPMDKEKFQSKIAKSHRDLLMALKEDIDEMKMTFGTKRIPAAMKKKGMDKVKTPGMAKDKSAGAYIGKMKKESTLERMNKKLQERQDG